MMINDEDTEDNDGGSGGVAADAENDVAGTAYRESLRSSDGFTRGANGRVKFNKDTKKRRREDAEDEDIEMADAEATQPNKKGRRRPQEKLGKEFKAKVCSTMFIYILVVLTTLYLLFREQAEMSRRTVWILTLTCLCSKPPKRSRIIE
jgi:hypothetical protein